VMRCLSIADALHGVGKECVFIVADENSARVAERGGYKGAVLHTRWDDMQSEGDVLAETLRLYNVGMLLVDSYAVTANYLQRLRALAKTAYMDDLNAFVYPVDMLINYNIYAGLFDYQGRYPRTELLLGCAFAPLRVEFSGVQPKLREKVGKVLVTMGGADPMNATGRLLNALVPRFEDVEFHVIVGRLNANEAMLKALTDEHPGIVLHKDVRRMSDLMLGCDAAVTAGGTTLYELCACGLPSVTVAIADNQIYAVREFERVGLMPCAGDLREDEAGCFAALGSLLGKYIGDTTLRRDVSAKMRTLVDGDGAARVARAIADLCEEEERQK
jgi:UDP-2,4-diacetamido-2,4,6-trideoxy-beta-L-altropyranose hydrolase